ncbi:MAG: hypothetical protein BZY79_00035 [SAR202 cluster bacterium Casp-Chloro-G4]|nr:twin-arginine translocase TatA/TatE family subunit [Chloroflexota bacterium]MDA1227420.1 twin-arginine translocase TatA/TatE family subunit [Chloroflexota bacterium]PKB62137.1 MAG: hypothetical protein BZY79_00035 [SAR202 cluster bacterium Casp-Chloro-G4]
MNFLGIGPPELIVVLLVAFIFLGPERMVEVARLFGRLTREVRKMTADVRDLVDVDELTKPRPTGKTDQQDSRPNQADTNQLAAPDASAAANSPSAPAESDGPVSFKSARELHRENVEEQADQQDALPPESQADSSEERS